MIGADRFAEEIELLPSEHVVWEGGASSKGLLIALLHGLTIIVFLYALFSVFTFGKHFYQEDNPDYIEVPVQTDLGNAVEKPEEVTKQPKKHINGTRFVAYWAVVFLAAIGIAVYGLSKTIRNYWLVATNERVCIRSGVFNRNVVTVDLDKVTSIRSFHGPIERRFRLHSIEIQHYGTQHNSNGWSLFDPNTIRYVDISKQLSSTLLKNWLPRDNPSRNKPSV